MLMFHFKIKEAVIYSICTIFFSQLAKLVSIFLGSGFSQFDLSMLLYIVPAALLGGVLGAYLSKFLSSEKVTFVFQGVILLVLAINIYNTVNLI